MHIGIQKPPSEFSTSVRRVIGSKNHLAIGFARGRRRRSRLYRQTSRAAPCSSVRSTVLAIHFDFKFTLHSNITHGLSYSAEREATRLDILMALSEIVWLARVDTASYKSSYLIPKADSCSREIESQLKTARNISQAEYPKQSIATCKR